jgi:hypothetical protein
MLLKQLRLMTNIDGMKFLQVQWLNDLVDIFWTKAQPTVDRMIMDQAQAVRTYLYA